MKNLLPFLIVVFTGVSCTKPEVKESLSYDKLSVEKMIFASNDSTKPYMKLSLQFTYPVKFYSDTLLHKMQRIFVTAFAGEEYAGRSPQGAFEAYEKTITDESVEMSSYLGDEIIEFSDYYQKVNTEVIDSTENMITVKTLTENYMGGAHGSYNVFYYNIRLKDAGLLEEKDIFNSGYENKLSSLISEGLKEKYGDSIDDILFETDEVQPNGNFYFRKDGAMVYVYNEYEIAPYSEGMIEVAIPSGKINELLRSEYKKKQDA